MKKTIKLPVPSKLASMMIKIGMPLITFVFIYILNILISAPENQKAWLYANAYAMLEYAVMSFTLIFCGAIIADIAEKHYKK